MSLAARRKPRQARAREKVEAILEAARVLLAEQGADAFNTNRIASDAGVGIGTLYEYFPNKQAIIGELIDRLSASETDVVLARLAEVEGQPWPETIRAVVPTVLELYRQNRQLYRTLWTLSDSPRAVGHRPGEQLVMEAVGARLAPLVRERGGDLEITVFTVFHMVESLCEQFAASGIERFGVERSAAEIVEALEGYLRV